MQILRKALSFGASLQEKREIYILYVRSALESKTTYNEKEKK